MDFLKKINFLKTASEIESRQLIAFGVIMSINFPLFYLLWMMADIKNGYENPWLRLSASLLCVPLIFHKKLPPKFKKHLALYWHFSVLYCLPFFFTFMSLMNHGSTMWVMNSVSALFFTMLLLRLFSFFVTTALGFLLAITVFYFVSGNFYYVETAISTYEISMTFFAAIVIGGVFAHSKFMVEKEKLVSIELISANIAHELRTPLAGLKSAISGLSRYYPTFLKAYNVAREKDLIPDTVRKPHLAILEHIFEDASVEIRYANMIIDTLLKNARQSSFNPTVRDWKLLKIAECVQEALERYPFATSEQKGLVTWSNTSDFYFKGEKLLLMHVIFNLLKNALYFIEKAHKGTITLWTKEYAKHNALHIRDTAFGIQSQDLGKVFTKFFTTEKNGTGLGLSFCKTVMQDFGGDMTCESEYGIFTQFNLFFPKIDELNKN